VQKWGGFYVDSHSAVQSISSLNISGNQIVNPQYNLHLKAPFKCEDTFVHGYDLAVFNLDFRVFTYPVKKQGISHRNVLMAFFISVSGPELLLLWPKLLVSRLKPKVSIPLHRLRIR
jgi:hypothetical protein